MKSFLTVLATAILVSGVQAQQVQTTPINPAAPVPCSQQSCTPTKAELKKARREFREGMAASSKSNLPAALDHFRAAALLSPEDKEYLTAREVTLQRLVFETLQRGNEALLKNNRVEALAAFRQANELDPNNTFAQQRLKDALPSLPKVSSDKRFEDADVVTLGPKEGKRNFHIRGNARDLLDQVTRAYGVTAVVDDSVLNRPVRLDLEDATWKDAVSVICRMTKTFWTPLSANSALFVEDNEQNKRQYQHVGLRTFYTGLATAQQLNDLTNTLRVLFDIRLITPNPANSSLTVRAPQETLDAATAFIESLDTGKPQVALEVEIFQISHTFAKNIGTKVPTNITVFNIGTEAQNLLNSSTVQSAISALQSSGVLSGNYTTAQLVAALISQGLLSGSLFSSPFFTFGGGTTLEGLTFDSASINFNRSDSRAQTLDHLTLRAEQGAPATIKLGSRIPIVNAKYSSALSSSAIASLLGTSASAAAAQTNYSPSFSYEDIGLTIKATPQVRRAGDVVFDLEIQIRSIESQTVNELPVIGNREFKGSISSLDGRSIVIASAVSKSESTSLTGLPLLSMMPGVSSAFSDKDKEINDDELLVVITPHIVSNNYGEGRDILVPASVPR